MKSFTKRIIQSYEFGSILTAALIKRTDTAVTVAPRANAGRVFMRRFMELHDDQKDVCFKVVADTDCTKLKETENCSPFVKSNKHHVDWPIIACMDDEEFSAFLLRRGRKHEFPDCPRDIVPSTNMLASSNALSPYLNKYVTIKHVSEFVTNLLLLSEEKRAHYFHTLQSLLAQTAHTDVADYIARNKSIPLDIRKNILNNYDTAHHKTQYWFLSTQLDLRHELSGKGRATALLGCIKRILRLGYTLTEPARVSGGSACS